MTGKRLFQNEALVIANKRCCCCFFTLSLSVCTRTNTQAEAGRKPAGPPPMRMDGVSFVVGHLGACNYDDFQLFSPSPVAQLTAKLKEEKQIPVFFNARLSVIIWAVRPLFSSSLSLCLICPHVLGLLRRASVCGPTDGRASGERQVQRPPHGRARFIQAIISYCRSSLLPAPTL